MKTLKRSYFVLILYSFALLIACSSDQDSFNGLNPSEINKMYTNKMASVSTDNILELSYNGNPLSGKNAYFELINDNHARINLLKILPGEDELEIEINSLSKIQNGGYTFTGNKVSRFGTAFSYSGSIVSRKLTLSLSDITLAENAVSSTSPWYNTKTVLEWQLAGNSLEWSIVRPVLSNLLNNLLLSVLHEVSFLPDGNIQAKYASLPEGDEFTDLISTNYNDRNPEDWNISPVNMAMYYIHENRLFVIPQVEMIQNAILGTKSTRAGLDEIVDKVLEILSQIAQWTNQGIQFTYTQSGNDLLLTFDKSQIEFIFPLLPYVSELIPDNVLPEAIAPLLESVLQDAAVNTTKFELTLTFSKEK